MKKSLALYESIKIEFDGHPECVVISGNGTISYDFGTHGTEENIFDQSKSGWISGRNEPNKLDKISMYLSLLYESQRAGHEVHQEISEALKQFKTEAGI